MTNTPATDLKKFFDYVDKHQDYFIGKLKDAVAIPSVSSQLEHRQDVYRMADWLEHEMRRLNVSCVERADVGMQELEGETVKLPPILLGTYSSGPKPDGGKKRCLLVYGHYDVQPALVEDGWTTDPWLLTEDEQGRLFARGASDDKGPVIAWLWVIEAHQKLGIDLPVDLKMCFEGMEESGSEGLDDLIKKEASRYFTGVDCVCISDNYWLGKDKPCLTHGLRGVSYFTVEVKGPGKDLHSGVFGGTIHEPMSDLVHLMSKLVTSDGTILVPGILDQVAPLTDDEKRRYECLDFSMEMFHDSLGAANTVHSDDKVKTLMHRWRYPSLSLHGIEGAFHSAGAKTVIPSKVIGKFSIRTVPNQDPDLITKSVVAYLEAEFAKLKSKNKVKVACTHAGKWWLSSPDHWNFRAGAKAMKSVFGVDPDFTREGGSIPVTLTFQEELKRNVLLLPIGACDDGAHSINEKIDRRNYVEGIKLMGSYLHELSSVII